jgi:hypothetical protein
MANPLLTAITGLGSGKSHEPKGVVKRDWVPTGRIDFATNLNGDADQPGEFKLLVEERRIVESIAGNEKSGDPMAAGDAEGGEGCRHGVP